ncbi:MAG: TIGR03885 family FMN-dependent LLM class oxidoreductase [Chitinophagaceae bacterium]|nr:TIGR03885 family FMN-dependent LLM class oxidoreductase [Chitinophagaceae bacterium]
MPLICYHSSHEQFSPSRLLKLVQLAEQAGFRGIHSSDHFHPWSRRQGQSGFTLSWIAAAMQATQLPFSMVCAPGQRLHPAIVAQAIATLAEMFPGRFNIELGSGEAINESITGQPWLPKPQRNERLLECYHIIKNLLGGEEVSYKGHVHVQNAKLYTLPQQQPLLLCAAITDETTAWSAGWADGLLTTAGETDAVAKKIELFRSHSGAGKPVYLQFAFSYARNKGEAQQEAYDQWRSNTLPAEQLADFARVEQFDEASEHVSPEEVLKMIPVYSDIGALLERIHQYLSLDIDRLILHNVSRRQEIFIEDYGKRHDH